MAHYDIFRRHLFSKFPAYGHALWDPDPGNLYPAVEVADVGYIREGRFHRLFNVLKPEEDESHEDFGVPAGHQLELSIRKHINICKLSPNNFCSAKVTPMPVDPKQGNGPEEVPKVSFSCPMKEGAVLCLPIKAKGENTVASADFGRWILKHIDLWFAWARERGLAIDRMEDIILVTGIHRARSWTNVAFPGGQERAQISLGARVDHRDDGGVAINWQFSHEHNLGAVLNCGPDGENLPEDQCIFIRGFRVTRKLKILPTRLKAAAGPNPDPKAYDEEPDDEFVLIPSTIPEYRDPAHILLEYIAEAAPPFCDLVLVHDDDLVALEGIYDSDPIDTIQPDVVLDRIRSLKPTLHNTRIDLSSTHSSASVDSDSAWVATISNIFDKRASSSTSKSPRVKALSPQREGSRLSASIGHDLCLAPATSFPEPIVPTFGGSLPRDSSIYTQQPNSSQQPDPGPPSPPPQITVPLTYPILRNASARALEPVAPHLGPGHVDHFPPTALSRTSARVSGHPLYHYTHNIADGYESYDTQSDTRQAHHAVEVQDALGQSLQFGRDRTLVDFFVSDNVITPSVYSYPAQGMVAPPLLQTPAVSYPQLQNRFSVSPPYNLGGHTFHQSLLLPAFSGQYISNTSTAALSTRQSRKLILRKDVNYSDYSAVGETPDSPYVPAEPWPSLPTRTTEGRFPSHFHDSRPTSATSSRNLPQCKLPRCEKPVIFDYRINEQREFCDEHIGLVIPVGFAGRCMMCRMPARLDSEFCSEACRCMNAQMEPSGTTGYHQPTVQPAVQEMVQTSATPPPSVRPERTYNLQFQRPWEPESGWDPPV